MLLQADRVDMGVFGEIPVVGRMKPGLGLAASPGKDLAPASRGAMKSTREEQAIRELTSELTRRRWW